MKVFEKSIDNEDVLLYTVQEVSELFKLSRTSAYSLVNSSGFPTLRINKRIFIPASELSKWIRKNTGKSFLTDV